MIAVNNTDKSEGATAATLAVQFQEKIGRDATDYILEWPGTMTTGYADEAQCIPNVPTAVSRLTY